VAITIFLLVGERPSGYTSFPLRAAGPSLAGSLEALGYAARVQVSPTSSPEQCLRPTATIESTHPDVVAYAELHASGVDPLDRAVKLYYAVRDGLRYDPYTAEVSESQLKASVTLATGRGWCVAKAVVLAACCRAVGIPARLGFADVRNHLSTARMRDHMQTDVFYWHGYTSIHLDGCWVKATPAFNAGLCEKFRLQPLEFDGRHDSIFHPFDRDGNRHMEYLRDRGEFADVPVDAMLVTFRENYPNLDSGSWEAGDFEREVDAEVGEPV
jgi:transglutaminase-like putative cysteine protease